MSTRIVQNPSQLREVLLGYVTSEIVEHGIIQRQFDIIVGSGGDAQIMRTSIREQFEGMCKGGQTTNAKLVYTCLSSWGIAFPGCEEEILKIVLELCAENPSSIACAGEGVIIALLSLFSETKHDEKLFAALFKGDLLTLFRRAQTTQPGAGLLSNVLSKFLKDIYDPNRPAGYHRLPQVMLLLQRYKMILERGGSAALFRNLGDNPETWKDEFFEHFTNELATRVFLRANMELKLTIIGEFLNHSSFSPQKKWLTEFPGMECAV